MAGLNIVQAGDGSNSETMRDTTWEASNKKTDQLVKWFMTFSLTCWPISGRQAKVARI